jgi:VanZ family protein
MNGVRTSNSAETQSQRWGWLFPALWCALILVASSIPDVTTPRGFFARDKIIHFAEYGVLGALTAAALAEAVSWRGWIRAIAAFGFCVLFGAMDEMYQITVSGRASDYLDLLSDGLGAAVRQAVAFIGQVRRGES